MLVFAHSIEKLYTYVGNDPLDRTDPTGLATSCDKNNCTITADNGPKEGRTITASVEVKAAVNVGKDAAATKSGSTEKLAAVEKNADGKLTVASVKGSGNGSPEGGTTAKVSFPGDTVAGIHGHIDTGHDRSNGMVDKPSANGGLGDASSLKVGIPMATVSQGQVGWHEMDNGTLKFSAPAGAMTSSQMSDMQRNLNVEQKQFP